MAGEKDNPEVVVDDVVNGDGMVDVVGVVERVEVEVEVVGEGVM